MFYFYFSTELNAETDRIEFDKIILAAFNFVNVSSSSISDQRISSVAINSSGDWIGFGCSGEKSCFYFLCVSTAALCTFRAFKLISGCFFAWNQLNSINTVLFLKCECCCFRDGSAAGLGVAERVVRLQAAGTL